MLPRSGASRRGRSASVPVSSGPDNDAAAAVTVWGRRDAGPQREPVNALLLDESAWEMAAQQIHQVRDQLASNPAGDVVSWSQAAHEAAGVLAVLSARMEPERPGPLARAADVLARSAQRTTEHRRDAAQAPGQLRGAPMAARYSRRSPVGEALALLALRNTLRAIFRMHEQREELAQARQIEQTARGELARLYATREQMMSRWAPPPPAVDPLQADPGRRTDRDGPQHGR
ncbi:hypothetical protein ACFZA1_37810 [Streptomyces filipinensis]|uniref:hypothetical protein n=1 Tax=Streptomyces filipinensis TaxID=66887 RepID=UPI0036E60409